MSLSSLFSRFKKHHVLVAGDFMMDSYTIGSVKRVSPEAPVIVVQAKNQKRLPGGAGNVLLNLISLGANVSALGRIGNDSEGEALIKSLVEEKANVDYLYEQKGYQTPVKNRVIAENQQIVRVDFEEKALLSPQLESKIIQDLPEILSSISVVAISDYAKGFLSPKLLSHLIQTANQFNIPVIVDPKGSDFEKYRGAQVIKPNMIEAYFAAGVEDDQPLQAAAEALFEQTGIENIMITRSSQGIALFEKNQRHDFPVKVKEVTDVTGAGDTVLAVLTFALSNQVSLSQAAILCNLAAAEVIEHMGCARISIKTLAELTLNQHLVNKVFSQNYLEVLQFILDHEAFILFKITLEHSLTPHFFLKIKQLKEEYSAAKLVIYLENEPSDVAIIELLASLSEVDFIIKKVSNLQKFCQDHAPEKIFHLRDDELIEEPSLVSLIHP